MVIKRALSNRGGFSLMELLVVIAIIGILAALLSLGLSRAKSKAKLVICANNLKQINVALHLYAGDNGGVFPNSDTNSPYSRVPTTTNFITTTNDGVAVSNSESQFGYTSVGSVYRELVKSYLGLTGASSPNDKVFACPMDGGLPAVVRAKNPDSFPGPQFQNPHQHYTSYDFNGSNKNLTGLAPEGLEGRALGAIRQPARAVLVMEGAAWPGYSWHQPQSKGVWVKPFKESPSEWFVYNDAMNELGFADGHVAYLPVHNSGKTLSRFYNPPAGYDYQWSGD